MKVKIIIFLLALIGGVSAVYYIELKKKTVYFGLVFAKSGDKLEIIVDDSFVFQETFNFNSFNSQGFFEISEENRYVMVDDYVPTDSIVKVRFILNEKKDTTLFFNSRKIKGVNIDCYKEKLSVFFDYRNGGMKYLFVEG